MGTHGRVSVNAGDLYRAIKNVLPFAAEFHATGHAISGLHVVVDREHVWTVCCDPYSLAFDRAALEGEREGPAWEVTIPRESVDLLLRALGQVKKELPGMAVLLTPDAIAITRLHTRIEYQSIEGYPDFLKVIPEGAGEPIATVVVNQELASRVQAVGGKHDGGVRYDFHGNLGVVECQVGDTFRAFLMPMRVPSAKRLTELPPRVAAPQAVIEAVAS